MIPSKSTLANDISAQMRYASTAKPATIAPRPEQAKSPPKQDVHRSVQMQTVQHSCGGTFIRKS